MKKVIVASKNPVKINSSRNAFAKLYGNQDFYFEGFSLPSGVSDQPMTDDETFQGAKNRAKNAKEAYPDADFWVGIEGGIDHMGGELVAFAWVVIMSSDRTGRARTGTFALPMEVEKLINQGIELGYANDQVFQEKESKKSGGAVGSLTNGVLGRTEYYEQAVMLALIPFLKSDLYTANS